MIGIEETTANPWEGFRSLFASLGTAMEQSSGIVLTEHILDILALPDITAEPDYLIISPSMKRRWLHLERIAALYARTQPHTHRKLRKAVVARVQARIEHGKRRIARIERRELREERRIIEGL